jgi:hypothetical protein
VFLAQAQDWGFRPGRMRHDILPFPSLTVVAGMDGA